MFKVIAFIVHWMECMLNLKICLFNHIQIVFTNHKYVFHNTIYKVIEIFHLELCNLKKIYVVEMKKYVGILKWILFQFLNYMEIHNFLELCNAIWFMFWRFTRWSINCLKYLIFPNSQPNVANVARWSN